jgi:hypothetical protein
MRRTVIDLVPADDLTAGVDPISGFQAIRVLGREAQVLYAVGSKERRPMSIPICLTIAYDLARSIDSESFAVAPTDQSS